MPKKRKTPIDELVVPPQNNRICGTICICQMTAILSSVAIVYLSMAIYFPSMRAFYSGIIEEPVMCSTSKVVTVDKCNWGSCGEWCLSKTSGACVQIYVNLRHNGTSLDFHNCTNSFNKTCYGIDQNNIRKYRCKQEECKNLTGTFNCTAGSCINITDVFDCVFHDTGDSLNCTGNRGKINCMDIEGLNTCTKGICAKIYEPYNCDRRCVDIPTRNKNVILISGDRVFLSQCQTITIKQIKSSMPFRNTFKNKDTDAVPSINYDNNDGSGTPADTLIITPPHENSSNANNNISSWNGSQPTTLLASCYFVTNRHDNVEATDCVNGTIIDKHLLSDLSNFTFLNSLTTVYETRSPQETLIAPLEVDLLIANDSRLMINLEGCVNTLREECMQFIKEYGKDGTDHNARARFPCFYAKMDPTMVIARFSLEVTYREFLPAAIIPAVLLVVSCFILVICQRTVEVGDDAKMRFKKRNTEVRACNSDKARSPNSKYIKHNNTIGDKGEGADLQTVNL